MRNSDDSKLLLHRAIQTFKSYIDDAERIILETTDITPQERAEGYRYLLGHLGRRIEEKLTELMRPPPSR